MSARDDVKLVVLRQVRNTIEAELFVALLEAAGIPATVEGRHMQDDFAVPQKLLGRMGVRVLVREEDRDEAERVLAAAREAGRGFEGGEDS
ncbi:MAG: DUF2007 domain-containing protein [Planctomycetes bacterium]|nr:DUF2007 domain-containing protein [Planctomycetota bacterium]